MCVCDTKINCGCSFNLSQARAALSVEEKRRMRSPPHVCERSRSCDLRLLSRSERATWIIERRVICISSLSLRCSSLWAQSPLHHIWRAYSLCCTNSLGRRETLMRAGIELCTSSEFPSPPFLWALREICRAKAECWHWLVDWQKSMCVQLEAHYQSFHAPGFNELLRIRCLLDWKNDTSFASSCWWEFHSLVSVTLYNGVHSAKWATLLIFVLCCSFLF